MHYNHHTGMFDYSDDEQKKREREKERLDILKFLKAGKTISDYKKPVVNANNNMKTMPTLHLDLNKSVDKTDWNQYIKNNTVEEIWEEIPNDLLNDDDVNIQTDWNQYIIDNTEEVWEDIPAKLLDNDINIDWNEKEPEPDWNLLEYMNHQDEDIPAKLLDNDINIDWNEKEPEPDWNLLEYMNHQDEENWEFKDTSDNWEFKDNNDSWQFNNDVTYMWEQSNDNEDNKSDDDFWNFKSDDNTSDDDWKFESNDIWPSELDDKVEKSKDDILFLTSIKSWNMDEIIRLMPKFNAEFTDEAIITALQYGNNEILYYLFFYERYDGEIGIEFKPDYNAMLPFLYAIKYCNDWLIDQYMTMMNNKEELVNDGLNEAIKCDNVIYVKYFIQYALENNVRISKHIVNRNLKPTNKNIIKRILVNFV